ncbi:hypothetical protein WNY37_15980 [Henriciella sp. AS95]|uniref:nuclear transport factor 2 family protein n=1 Tax=Henriciella sp. AS95 TaxID=3135782 RepID=UPI00316E3119
MSDVADAQQPEQEDAAARADGRRLDRVNRWLTLAANLGVLLGLIVLIVEVRQSASMSRLSHETARAAMMTQMELSLASPAASDAWMKAIHSPVDLTDGELRMAETQLVAIMQQWDILFNMEQEGLVERARTKRHIENTAPFYFGSRFAKRWWEREEIGWAGTPMFEVAAPIVTAIDPDFLVEHYASIRVPFSGSMETEAEAFMAAYGDDLRAGDRSALVQRYASSGAVMVLNGEGGHKTHQEIAELYSSGWTPPSSFEWLDLAFDPIGTDAVAVSGTFHWGAGEESSAYAYTGVLKREDGALRIALENEIRLVDQTP